MAERRLILDSGALSALADGDERAVAWARVAIKRQFLFAIPAPVLAETLSGQAADSRVYRVIRNDFVLDTTAAIARSAGRLRHRSRRRDGTIDAIVIATAAEHPGSIVLTSDPDDLQALANDVPEAKLSIRSVSRGPK